MTEQQDATRTDFLKSFVYPVLWIFLIPVIGFFFFNHAESYYDNDVLAATLAKISKNKDLSDEQKAAANKFFRENPVSELLASDVPEHRKLVSGLAARTKFDYAQFRWGVRLSALSMIVSVVATVIVLLFVLLSLQSQAVQYYSLSIGWHVLKLVCLLQVLVQGVLVFGLSFWITALWLNMYSLQVVAGAGIVAVAAVGLILKAMFVAPESEFAIQGEKLDLDKSPEFRDRIGSICRHLQIDPPDQVLVGIDNNFFVTEHPVKVNDRTYHGKTLYLSISLLKKLERSEAEAILAHEMAHFSGQDTVYSKKISPLLGKYSQYLGALHEGTISMPVFYFMFFFWSMYQISLGRLARSREFRADSLAASTISPTAVDNSLAKVQAYGYYRSKIEANLFDEKTLHQELKIAQRVTEGFSAFVDGTDLHQEIYKAEIPHPFDSHPPFEERLKNVGADLSQITKAIITKPVEGSWHDKIADAEALERKMWQEYEDNFKKAHEGFLAHRLMPREPWEIALVKKHFPDLTLEGGDGQLILDYQKVHYTRWDEPVYFHEISGCVVEERVLKISRTSKPAVEVRTNWFEVTEEEVLEAFSRYYGRHQIAEQFEKMESQEENKS